MKYYSILIFAFILFLNNDVSAQVEKSKVKENKKTDPVIEHKKKELAKAEVEKTAIAEDNSFVYTTADINPQFKGGLENQNQWIQQNLSYPQAVIEQKKEGKVIVEFIVEKDGKITNPVIVRDAVGLGAGDAVIQMMKKMPYFIPGQLKGQPVRVKYVMPVSIKFNQK